MLAVSLCMGMSTTAMAAEGAFHTDESISLSESRYSDMWVGDCIQLNAESFTYEITEGAENVEMNLTDETLKFINAGTTKIAVKANDDENSLETYTFTISPAEEAYVVYEIPQTIKVGYTVGDTVNMVGDSENAYV